MSAATAVTAAAVTATPLSERRQRKNTTGNGTDGKSHKLLYRELTSTGERKQGHIVLPK
jgi:hypothetical protein